MNPKYHISIENYTITPFSNGGLAGKKYIATSLDGKETLLVKGELRNTACAEFVALQLAARMGILVPEAKLFIPKTEISQVGIEWLGEAPMPSREVLCTDKRLLSQTVSAVLTHVLFEDDDTVDFSYHDGNIYTYDFGEAFSIDDIYIRLLEDADKLSKTVPQDALNRLLYRDVSRYSPNTLLAMEILVSEWKICSREYVSEALKEVCRKFLEIQQDEIDDILSSLAPLYPPTLMDYLKRYLGQVAIFCSEIINEHEQH